MLKAFCLPIEPYQQRDKQSSTCQDGHVDDGVAVTEQPEFGYPCTPDAEDHATLSFLRSALRWDLLASLCCFSALRSWSITSMRLSHVQFRGLPPRESKLMIQGGSAPPWYPSQMKA